MTKCDQAKNCINRNLRNEIIKPLSPLSNAHTQAKDPFQENEGVLRLSAFHR